MPKLVPVPTELSKPFWDAINEKRLVVQHCTACDAKQYPPRPRCNACGADKLDWSETSGRGHVLGNMVVYDGRFARMHPDQPYNVAVITLDDDPGINFYSNMPGVAAGEVPVGAAVEVIFEELQVPTAMPPEIAQVVSPHALIHEWRLIG